MRRCWLRDCRRNWTSRSRRPGSYLLFHVCGRPSSLSELAVEFATVGAHFDGELAFGVCEVEVCDRFARGEEEVYVARVGEEFEGDVPGGRALFGDEADDFRLA